MSTLLMSLAAAAGAIVLTWFFCVRPMRSGTGTACCAPTSRKTDELIRAAREKLSQMQAAPTGTSPDTPHPSCHGA